MLKEVLILGGAWTLMSILFSAFIVLFDRNKFTTPKMGFIYIVFSFVAGIAMLATSLVFLK